MFLPATQNLCFSNLCLPRSQCGLCFHHFRSILLLASAIQPFHISANSKCCCHTVRTVLDFRIYDDQWLFNPLWGIKCSLRSFGGLPLYTPWSRLKTRRNQDFDQDPVTLEWPARRDWVNYIFVPSTLVKTPSTFNWLISLLFCYVWLYHLWLLLNGQFGFHI